MQLKQQIKQSALSLVKQIGWNDHTLLKAVKDHSISTAAARALFPNGIIELAEDLMIDWENQMSQEISTGDLEGRPIHQQLHLILKKRLKSEEEYMPGWRDAMLLGLYPTNVFSIRNRLYSTMNTAWEIIGDQATGLEWSLKRMGLGQVFVATEIHMVHDGTPGFRNTYEFLESQLENKDFSGWTDLGYLYLDIARYLGNKFMLSK